MEAGDDADMALLTPSCITVVALPPVARSRSGMTLLGDRDRVLQHEQSARTIGAGPTVGAQLERHGFVGDRRTAEQDRCFDSDAPQRPDRGADRALRLPGEVAPTATASNRFA